MRSRSSVALRGLMASASRSASRLSSVRSSLPLSSPSSAALSSVNSSSLLSFRPFSSSSSSTSGEVKEAELVEEAPVYSADSAVPKNEKEMSFQTETSQILDIVVNSLYTDKEVFVREIISNASDALEKARYLQMTQQKELLDNELPLEIRVEGNEEKGLITITDTGVGMTEEELITHLGTIAKSGSKSFVKQIKEEKSSEAISNIIGQFGVGFYSCYMVGDKVEVFSQSATDLEGDHSLSWTSDGHGSFKVGQIPRKARGTTIRIHLKPQFKEYASKPLLETIIKKHSNYIGFPLFLNGEKVNTVGAVWLKSPSEVSDDEYQEFYQHYAESWDSFTYRLHFHTDVPLSLSSLLFFPERHMEKFGMGRIAPGVSIYARKVLIKARSEELLPDWLRFVRGVVDSEDIPLNISRENMQDSALLQRISGILTRKIIKYLDEESKRDPEKYRAWFIEFGNFLKEGATTDWNNRKEVAKLLRFESSLAKDNFISLDEYISRMPVEQKSIFYLSAPNRKVALASPYYESYKKKGLEVLFLYSPVDEFVMSNVGEYGTRPLLSIEKADEAQLNEEEKEENAEGKEQKEEKKREILAYISHVLADQVSSVTASSRLVSSPALIVGHQLSGVRKMMKLVDQSQESPFANPSLLGKQRLEVNLSHPLLQKIGLVHAKNPLLAKNIVLQIFNNALIQADMVDDPRTLVPRLTELMDEALNVELKGQDIKGLNQLRADEKEPERKQEAQ